MKTQLPSLLSPLLHAFIFFSPHFLNLVKSNTITCGCDECTPAVLATLAGPYPCGDRIRYLMNDLGYTEANACRKVAGEEFPTVCGPMCNPDKCDDDGTPSPITPSPTYPPAPAPSSLYCFPNDDGVSRVTYSNMWTHDGNDGYEVQVKEGNVCGPGNNRFSRNTVSRSNDELTLQFKRNSATNAWEASEVRMTQSNGQPYTYGYFTFHVKSVAVVDSTTGNTISDLLPPNIVLGLFTWDPTDRYSIHENWNHEVDIEISRWNEAGNADTQFLVQPPKSPQMYRFFSGTSPNTYQQSDQWHSFRWLPNVIHWNSTAGGGHTHSYSTEQAITAGIEDYVQCLPADVEMRMNLWSTSGLWATPVGMSNDQYIEVVIDHFAYHEATGIQYAAPGDYCSKHCQCEAELGCVNGRCIAPQTPAPTPTPTASVNPSAPPSTTTSCKDSTFVFRTKENETDTMLFWKKCKWVGEEKETRCKWRDNWRMCPLTCNKCDVCKDPKAVMKFYESPDATKKTKKRCSWTKKDALTRCAIEGMEDACRQACGNCN